MDSELSCQESSFTGETANNMLKELQTWWEIPSIAQYISLFREAFNLPEIEIEELENGLIDDCVKGPNEWLENLVIAFLKSIMPNRVNATNWELHLKRLLKRKWAESPFADKENPFADDEKSFHDLNLRTKVDIIYSLCLYRFDSNDITEAMKSMDADALRVQKLGVDDAENTYWYFYGTRLYRGEPIEERRTWDEEWTEQKRKSLTKRRGRGRPPKKQKEEEIFEDTYKDDRFMNVSEKSRWSVACDTLEEWVNFAEKFKNSKSKNEKSLFQIISENFLPTLSKIYEEKERKLQEKIKELLPAREKIVTRRETRRLRGETGGEINYALLNGYDSEDEDYKHINDYSMLREVKSRAERLEERNKRASEIQSVTTHKRMKYDDESRASSESSENSVANSESGELDVKSQMIKLLSSVKLHKDAWPFLYPVDENDAPGYYEIIKDPVDLSTIESRLYKGVYETVGDLDEDFSKMVSNCELYNGENHAYSKMAQTLRLMFRKEIAILLEMMEAAENSNVNSEESNDSQYNSSSNSNASSPPYDSPVAEPIERKKVKDKKKKKRHGRNMEALDMLAQASDISVQDNITNSQSSSSSSSSPPQKVPPIPQNTRHVPCYMPSTNMPYNAASSSNLDTNKTSIPVSVSNFTSTNSSLQGVTPVTSCSSFISANSPSQKVVPVTSSSFISVNSSPQGTSKNKPVIIRTKAVNVNKSPIIENVAPTSLNTTPDKSSNVTMQQTNVNQPFQTVVVSRSPVIQNDLKIPNNPMTTATIQSNMCLPNGLPVLQQVVLPSGTLANTGQQYIIASPQNTFRIISKDQSISLQNSIGQLNQGFVKVVPQLIAPTMQLPKDGMQNFQLQTLSPNSTQTFTQVPQSPQFVSVPCVISNPSTMTYSTSQPTINYQPFQISTRPMHIGGQGNG